MELELLREFIIQSLSGPGKFTVVVRRSQRPHWPAECKALCTNRFTEDLSLNPHVIPSLRPVRPRLGKRRSRRADKQPGSVLVRAVWPLFLVGAVFCFLLHGQLMFPLRRTDGTVSLFSLSLRQALFPIPTSPLFQLGAFSAQLWLTDFCVSFPGFSEIP